MPVTRAEYRRLVNTREDHLPIEMVETEETPEQARDRRREEAASRKLKDAAHLEPEKLDLEPDEGSEHAYENWRQRWDNYMMISGLDHAEDIIKHHTLFSRVGLKVSGCLKGKTTYDSVIEALDALYLTKRNELFLRHQAMKIKQGELDVKKFGLRIQEKLRLCTWENRTAVQAEEDFAKVVLIEGLAAGSIRQRLLEDTGEKTFRQLLDQAEVLEQSHRQALSYESRVSVAVMRRKEEASGQSVTPVAPDDDEREELSAMQKKRGPSRVDGEKCPHCGYVKHQEGRPCPARKSGTSCANCKQFGHWARRCKLPRKGYPKAGTMEESSVSNAVSFLRPVVTTVGSVKLEDPEHCLFESALQIKVDGNPVVALLDTGASMCYIRSNTAKKLKLRVMPSDHKAVLADGTVVEAEGEVTANLEMDERKPTGRKQKLIVMGKGLLSDLIVGLDFLKQFEAITIEYPGKEKPLTITRRDMSGKASPASAGVKPRRVNATSEAPPGNGLGGLPTEASYNSHRMLHEGGIRKTHRAAPMAGNGLGGPSTEASYNSHGVLQVKRFPAARLLADPDMLFQGLDRTAKPIKDGSRRYSVDDREFMKGEIKRLLETGIVEESHSPWRSQPVISKKMVNGVIKKRLCIDYSRTVNTITPEVAFPIPRIEDIVNDAAKYQWFTKFDLKSAYHQIELDKKDRPYTAFECFDEHGSRRLYQFTRLPFGVTNAVPLFQKSMTNVVKEDKLTGTLPYLDDVVIGGKTESEHDLNVKRFLNSCEKRGITLNEKTVNKVKRIQLLGYLIENGKIAPDPERMIPLREMPLPSTPKELQRVVGLFAYYAKWIVDFSSKIRPLAETKFPVSQLAAESFEALKKELERVSLASIDEEERFQVETDASDVAVSATLNQRGRPVAFFSRTLNPCQRGYPAAEKEAMAIVEAVRHWAHLLHRRPFTLVTDQAGLKYVFDRSSKSKIKANKVQLWRWELSEFSYEVKHRPGKLNCAPDALSRSTRRNSKRSNISAMIAAAERQELEPLKAIHRGLCCPGRRRLFHLVKQRSLPFSVEDCRRVCDSCPHCKIVKPQFFRKEPGTLIRATQPWERVSIDIKTPSVTSSKGFKHVLVAIDEYSRFPFAFPIRNATSKTVIECLNELFGTYGTPGFIHSDRGSQFNSRETIDFLRQVGVPTSRSTPYHPQGNSQVERLIGTFWRAVQCRLQALKKPPNRWDEEIVNALHSIRSLLCTATGETPHERFLVHRRRTGPEAKRSLPTWLMNPGPLLWRNFDRERKSDPLTIRVQLLEPATEHYALVRMPDGRETTVSLSDLSPAGDLEDTEEETEPAHVAENPYLSGGQNSSRDENGHRAAHMAGNGLGGPSTEASYDSHGEEIQQTPENGAENGNTLSSWQPQLPETPPRNGGPQSTPLAPDFQQQQYSPLVHPRNGDPSPGNRMLVTPPGYRMIQQPQLLPSVNSSPGITRIPPNYAMGQWVPQTAWADPHFQPEVRMVPLNLPNDWILGRPRN